ncbi:MlaC/ttg2D family ABC transporter substrate-binding protein [Aromatoleum aromaticum]|uniref:Toluene tolerance protein n=1 Tax=Aromatoleum aromaticum (strain DSM 19018 / LMG 30748 / EbN1) TaxID=76114 RepID=Q5P125_AROAE|nr:ABC transporter substrate-binding protein [Aromatoleum aromaticum]CAI08989.1 putative toluene tolerance protein [Aromatoleum aromaticum EbN1]
MPMFARSLLAVVLLLASLLVAAQSKAPDALVKDVTEEVLKILSEDKQIRSGDSTRAAELIETRIAPHFDFPRMTALAVGRHWTQANEEQRSRLAEEFRTLLVRTYANALTEYRDETVTFKPMRQGPDAKEVVVQSQINKPGGQPIDLDYRLVDKGGEWKVIDVTVAGVSLVTNYRSSFNNEISSGGIEGLLKALQEKNRNPQAPASTAGGTS